MGYSTDFYGFWALTPALSLAQTDYLQKFSRTRRVKRDPDAIKNNRRLAGIGLDLGVDAEYFVDTEDEDASIVDLNLPPGNQPSLWCQWRVNDQGDRLEHTGGEKFDEYVEWLEYLVERFFLRHHIFRVIYNSKAEMLIYSRYWGSIWLPDKLVDRFLVVPDKLAVRCSISIEQIDDPDCRYRVVRCEDSNRREHPYPANSLWQIDRLRSDDQMIALDPFGNPIAIDRSGLDCFVSIDIVLQEFSI